LIYERNTKILKLLTIITKLFQLLPAELSHSIALKGIKLIAFMGFRLKQYGNSSNLNLFNKKLKNSLGLAAGLDKNGDYIDSLSSLGFGFLEIGTVTPKPQYGNPKPRLFRDLSSKAIINKMGFNNKGVDYLVNNLRKRKSDIPIGVSIGKNFDTPNDLAKKDYIYCLEKVFELADYIAINISSPNTRDLRKLEIQEVLTTLLESLKNRQLELSEEFGYKPLFLKISPDNSEENIKHICKTMLKFSIDGLICTNTTVNHNHISGSGGLSGKPLMRKSTEILKLARSCLGDKFPIIASGGVMSKEDYQNKIDTGADLVQVYTGFIYEGPKLIDDILNH
tara:strand:- start:90 stop:1100 length:1011 start_codon:yes stop_codon:yes gene_type:complete